jgi:transposase
MNIFAVRAAQLAGGRSELFAAVGPLLKAREAIERQILDLDRKVLRLARNNTQVRRFMTTPGIGPVTALCFLATIDDPARFKRSRSVGAYAGLTTRRYASGEIDWTGRISKCGDKMLRSYLSTRRPMCCSPVSRSGRRSKPGGQTCEAKRAAQSQGSCRSQACRHSAPNVDRRYRIRMVIKGGC